MPELTLQQRLRRQHATVFRSHKRFKIVVAGRRWGKTWLALWCLVVHAFSGGGRICYYIAPNYRQAKRIAWGVLKQLVPIEARCRSSEQELSIQLHNGSIIQLHGADNFDSLRGVGLDFVVLDECYPTEKVAHFSLAPRLVSIIFMNFTSLPSRGVIGKLFTFEPRTAATSPQTKAQRCGPKWTTSATNKNSKPALRLFKLGCTTLLIGNAMSPNCTSCRMRHY